MFFSFAFERERALTARQLHLGHAAGDADLSVIAPTSNEASRPRACRSRSRQIRPLEGLEALKRDLEGIRIGTDDGE
jgi:hypothetical protein